MTNIADENLLLDDFASFTEADITLSEEQIHRAGELSQPILDSQQKWQTYLNALALFGFIDWLAERDESLTVDIDNCSVTLPHYANFIDGVFNLQVGEFQVCLLTNGVAIDEVVTIPRAILEIPQYQAQLYIVVDVVEEMREITIASFITHSDLEREIEANDLASDEDWTYEVPATWFNIDTNDILLYLRCLAPAAIPLPEATPIDSADIQEELASLASSLQSSNKVWEVLSWDLGKQVLANGELLSWLYQLQNGELSLQLAIAALREGFSNTLSQVSRQIINVRSWLNAELDDMAQSLAWNLLPAPAFATSAFRDLRVTNRNSPVEEFEAILSQLRNEEDVPVNASGAFQDLELEDLSLRLFAVTWEEAEPEAETEWNLLLILGARQGSYLPQNLKLRISLAGELLDEQTNEADSEDTYLYSRVIAEPGEQLTASINLQNGASITLPPFSFE